MLNGTASSGLTLAAGAHIEGAAGRLGTPADEESFVTIAAAADLIGVEETDIEAMMRSGRLPFRKGTPEDGRIVMRCGIDWFLGKSLCT